MMYPEQGKLLPKRKRVRVGIRKNFFPILRTCQKFLRNISWRYDDEDAAAEDAGYYEEIIYEEEVIGANNRAWRRADVANAYCPGNINSRMKHLGMPKQSYFRLIDRTYNWICHYSPLDIDSQTFRQALDDAANMIGSRDLADFLGISPSTLYRWRRRRLARFYPPIVNSPKADFALLRIAHLGIKVEHSY